MPRPHRPSGPEFLLGLPTLADGPLWRTALRLNAPVPDLSGVPVVGVGSMCRRHFEGDAGILRVVDTLDRALGAAPSALHLFGVKTSAMAELRSHPRLRSLNSQAYGIRCRREAHRGGFAKTNAYVSGVMADWYRQQRAILARPPTPFQAPLTPLPPTPVEDTGCLPPAFARRLARAAEEMRELYEAGEIEWADFDPRQVWESAFA